MARLLLDLLIYENRVSLGLWNVLVLISSLIMVSMVIFSCVGGGIRPRRGGGGPGGGGCGAGGPGGGGGGG